MAIPNWQPVPVLTSLTDAENFHTVFLDNNITLPCVNPCEMARQPNLDANDVAFCLALPKLIGKGREGKGYIA
eukprot:1139044-Pelagomonas_calceolata.AAC.1